MATSSQSLSLGIVVSAKDSASATLGRTRQNIESISRQLEQARNLFLSFQAALGASAGLSGLAAIVDQVSSANARLRQATGSFEQFVRAQQLALRLSAQTGAGYEALVNLYSRLSLTASSFGLSQERVAAVTQLTAHALQVSGASAAESASVITQLSQALGSGVLRGEEFNAIMENGGRLARALADGLGRPIGELRKLAEQGLLTTDIVVAALETQRETLAREAAAMPRTIGASLTAVRDAFGQTVARMNEATGATRVVGAAFDALARNMDAIVTAGAAAAVGALTAVVFRGGAAVRQYVVELAGKIASERAAAAATLSHAQAQFAFAQARLAEAQATVAATTGMARLTAVQNVLIPAQQRLAAAQAALNAAMGATVGIAARLQTALAFVGGPIGLITSLLAAGATAWALWGSRAESAADRVRATAERAADALDRLQRERRFGTGDAALFRERIEDLRAEERRLQELAERGVLDVATGQFVPDEGAIEQLGRVRDELRRYQEELRRIEAEQPAGPAAPTEAQRKLALAAWNAYIAQYRTKAEQLQAAIEELRSKASDAGIAESSEQFQRALAAVRARFAGRPQDLSAELSAAQRAALEAELSIVREGLTRAKDALDASLQDRLVSIRDYYAQKTAIEQREIEATIERTRQELAAQQQIARSAPQESDRIRARGEVAKLESELIVLNSRRSAIEQVNARAAAQAERELADALAQARDELARMSGAETDEQRRAGIARQFADLRARLAAEGDTEGLSLIDRLIDVRSAQANLDALEARYRQTLARMQADAELVRIQQEAGLLTETAARERIVELQRQAADEAQRLLPAMQQAAQAVGPEAELRVRGLTVELARLRTTADEFAAIWQGIGGAFASVLDGLITRATTWRDAMQALFVDVARVFRQELVIKPMQEWIAAQARMLAVRLGLIQQQAAAEKAAAAQSAATKAAEAQAHVSAEAAKAGAGAASSQASIPVAGPVLAIAAMTAMVAAVMALMGKIRRFATGGTVPGHGDRDTVPALLTPGEYVIRKAAVKRFGTAFLDAINGLRLPPAVIDGKLAFAAGGMVPAASSTQAQRGPDIRIINAVDPAIARQWLESPAGERVLVNVIGRNATAIRNILGG